MTFDEVMEAVENGEEGHLAHYGVKGMKWGVRKQPERSGSRRRRSIIGGAKSAGKYAIRSAKRLGAASKRVVKKTTETYQAHRTNSLNAKLQKDRTKAAKEEMRELRSKDARRQRQKALTTHNPSELAKYQHLLSDEELNARYKRLELENKVTQMSIKSKNAKFASFKSKADWAMNSPVGKSAIKMVENTAQVALDKVNGKQTEKAVELVEAAINSMTQQETNESDTSDKKK